MKNSTIALALFCALNFSLAHASPHPWQKLKPAEREALAPIQTQWDGMSEGQQEDLLLIAEHYTEFSADEKKRFLSRMAAWVRLTPEQKQAARDKYHAFSKVPAEKREEVKQMIRENQGKKTP